MGRAFARGLRDGVVALLYGAGVALPFVVVAAACGALAAWLEVGL